MLLCMNGIRSLSKLSINERERERERERDPCRNCCDSRRFGRKRASRFVGCGGGGLLQLMEQKTSDDGVVRVKEEEGIKVAMEDMKDRQDEVGKARQRWRWKARARQGASVANSTSSARSQRRSRKTPMNSHMDYPESLPSFMPYYFPLMSPIPSPTVGSPVPWLVPPITCAEPIHKCSGEDTHRSLIGGEDSHVSLIQGDAVTTRQNENDSPLKRKNSSILRLQSEQNRRIAESTHKCSGQDTHTSLIGGEDSHEPLIQGDAVTTCQDDNDSPMKRKNSSISRLQPEQSEVEKCGLATEIHLTNVCHHSPDRA